MCLKGRQRYCNSYRNKQESLTLNPLKGYKHIFKILLKADFHYQKTIHTLQMSGTSKVDTMYIALNVLPLALLLAKGLIDHT